MTERIQTTEVEREIGLRERAFDLAKRRVDELELALKDRERLLDNSHYSNYSRDRVQRDIIRIERDLEGARKALDDARANLNEAWSLRTNTSPGHGA